MKTFLCAVAAGLALLFGAANASAAVEDRVETYLKNTYYPFQHEPWQVLTAKCDQIGNFDLPLVECEMDLQYGPIHIYDVTCVVQVIDNDPIDLRFCEWEPCQT